MKKNYTRSILTFCIIASLSSITHAEPVKETPAVLADLTAAKEWRLAKLGDKAVAEGAGVTLSLGVKDQVSGSGGVNRYGGQYELKADGQITIKDIFATQMAALDEDLMKQESQFLQLLGKAKRALLSDGKLVIECEGEKQNKLVFVAVKKEKD